MESTNKTLATKDYLTDLLESIKSANTDALKWMFIFWLGQIAATFIIFLLFVKK
jgi:hypothetical protein